MPAIFPEILAVFSVVPVLPEGGLQEAEPLPITERMSVLGPQCFFIL